MFQDTKLNFRRAKHSNATKNFTTHIPDNGLNTIRGVVLTQGSEFRCHYHFGKSSEKISSRRPRLIRGLYLGKEPLEHQKSSTEFRFSFQKPYDKIYTENYGKKSCYKRRVIFPMSMRTELCHLQARPVRCRQANRFRVADRNSENEVIESRQAARQHQKVATKEDKRRNKLKFVAPSHSTERSSYARLFPQQFHEAEKRTFKMDDYDIWSRTSRK